MKLTKLFIVIIILTLFSSCAGSKIDGILKQGNVLQEDFKTTIPFTYVNGWIVIEAKIQNSSYNFLIDTGSSNILTKELAAKLDLKLLGTEKISDINSKKYDADYTVIENIKIGDIDFNGTIAAITDLNEITEISCIKIDGIIGSNLMRKAVWDFDFKNQLITFTNNENKLNFPSDYIESKMFIGTAGIPSVIVNINGQRTLNNKVDFGNAGDNILRIDYFKNQIDNGLIKKVAKANGKSFGAFGRSKNNDLYHVIIDEMELGKHTVNNIFANVKQGSGGNLGLEFFKNYRVMLNWHTKKLKMVQVSEPDKDEYLTYGFNILNEGNSIIVNYITESSSASKYLEQGDVILRINNTDYSDISEDDYCNILYGKFIYNNTEPLAITVKRNGQEVDLQLIKTELF